MPLEPSFVAATSNLCGCIDRFLLCDCMGRLLVRLLGSTVFCVRLHGPTLLCDSLGRLFSVCDCMGRLYCATAWVDFIVRLHGPTLLRATAWADFIALLCGCMGRLLWQRMVAIRAHAPFSELNVL